jgi:flap endonuclease-1
MGILGLGGLLSERAPQAIKEGNLKNYFGRRVAIDASMSIYQFVIAMQSFEGGESAAMCNDQGVQTTHLIGLWTRTLRMLDEGVKPVYVFDGAPPELKKRELDKRRDRANAARVQMETAKEEGDDEAMEQFAKRTVRLSREQMDECKKLLTLMGLPVVQAASEAEAQCVELVKKGKAWAVATEDMDALCFGAPMLLRHLGASDPKKRPVQEYRIDGVLQQLGFTMPMFIDLCILMGCDYCPRVPGIGPVKAFEAMQTHKTLEAVLASLDKTRHPVSDAFCFKEARELFVNPPVVPGDQVEIAFREPDKEGLMQYLVGEKQFDAARVERGIERLKEALARKTQVRLDQFFSVRPAALPVHTTQLKAQAGTRRTASGGPAAGGPARPANDAAAPGAAAAAAAPATGHKKAITK